MIGAEPAFPEVHIHHFMTDSEGKEKEAIVPRFMSGLTKREYFAAMAMQGIMPVTATLSEAIPISVIAKDAVKMADALIAELNKP